MQWILDNRVDFFLNEYIYKEKQIGEPALVEWEDHYKQITCRQSN